ncbi:MAG: MerR family transcriptional regulator [Acidobacteria bacterium]|nr:MerR family transcriptional regulator [Acidobacteriota bacterium]
MNTQAAVAVTETEIPDKLYFKIGEVCDLVGVQAHVLRYWESEFPSFQPQKNRAGQRTYRRKDVEMALRIKALLYGEGFTIAGAKRKLSTEGRANAPRLKIVPPNATIETLMQDDDGGRMIAEPATLSPVVETLAPTPRAASRAPSSDGLQRLKFQLEDILTTLNSDVLQ